MKVVERQDIIAKGDFPTSAVWEMACAAVEKAVRATDWPHGSGKFTIYPESGKRRREGNGVLPIKTPCLSMLRKLGWDTENLPEVKGGVLRTGDLDALLKTELGYIGFEWETGNISSSHRALNKLLLTLLRGGIKGGFLVVPSERLRVFLTDRVGNIAELRPYFPLWSSIQIKDGALRILVVEYDGTSTSVPRIPKGTDGRAKG